MKLLVIGATGKIGSEIARQSAAYPDIDIIAGVRDLVKARTFLGDDYELRRLDFDDPSTFEYALDGVDMVFFVAVVAAEKVAVFLDAVAQSNVQRVTFSSGRTTGDVEGMSLFKIEQLIREGQTPYVIFRPGWFMQNFHTWIGATIKEEDAFYLPAGETKTAFIDVRDIATACLKSFLTKEYLGQTIGLTCGESITHTEVAAAISEAAGREVRYVALSSEEYTKTMMERGWTKNACDYTNMLYDYVRAGKEDHVDPALGEILGRRPYTIQDYARDYQAHWLK